MAANLLGKSLQKVGYGSANLAKPLAKMEFGIQNVPFELAGKGIAKGAKAIGIPKLAQAIGKTRLIQNPTVQGAIEGVNLFRDKFHGASQAVKNALNGINGRVNEVNRFVAQRLGQQAQGLTQAQLDAIAFNLDAGIKTREDITRVMKITLDLMKNEL